MKHEPVSKEFHAVMNSLADALDEILNGKGGKKRVGYALLIYNFDETIEGTGRVNYIGNGKRGDVLIALKELVARWEGRYDEPSGVQ